MFPRKILLNKWKHHNTNYNSTRIVEENQFIDKLNKNLHSFSRTVVYITVACCL